MARNTQPGPAARVERLARTLLPTAYGTFAAIGYRDTVLGCDHVALVAGDVEGGDDVLVRMHSECLTGEAFGSLRCDCGEQLSAALRAVTTEGRGVVVYLRGHEGRSIGLGAKLAAYELQDAGYDTVDANVALGYPPDAREYGGGAAILADLGIRRVRLLSNNPDKAAGLRRHGVTVRALVPLVVAPGRENLRYLGTKRDRMGHDLPADVDLEGTAL